jgi:hypothetical protein
MTPRNIIGTLALIGFVVAIAFVPSKIRTWRRSRQFSREIAWIQEAVQQIEKSHAPTPELIQSASTGRWETAHSKTEGYLVFSNGWAACRTHSWHRNDGLDDIAVLKMPDGNFYLSRCHFCLGIQAETVSRHATSPVPADGKDILEVLSERGDHSQPADAKDFLDNGARWQGWYLFSRDGKLQCIVRSPHEDHRQQAKGLWVWIGMLEGTNSKTLFQKRYTISAGREMSWTANWTSDDEINLDVLDYGGNSPRMMGVDFPKRLLTTLIFQRDKQNGMYLEKTNILRSVAVPR